jgi:outer membrane protein TolC
LEASRVLYSNLLDGQIDAATAGALVVLQQYGRLQQEIRFLAISAYYDVQRALRRREVDQEAVAAMQAHSELSEKLLQIGKIPELDVLRVHVQLADVRQRLVTAQNAVELALLRLRNAMGISDDVALSVEAPPANLAPELSPTPLLDELLSRAYAERPEAVAAEAQIARYEAEQRQAAAGLRPEVRAIASYYREGTSLSLDYDNWYLGVRASLPLRDGRGTKYAVDAAKANRRAAEADLETVRQRIRLEVNEAWLLIREASERIIATQAAVQEATRALEIERRRYELGMNTVLDVLDTQTAMTRAQYNYVDAYFAYYTALAKLRLAVGETVDGQEPAAANIPGER